MIKNNSNLHKAKAAKNDCFYTRYEDIENECQHYIKHFKDQWIYLPCDDEKSNFWKYFVDHFKEYKIRHLTATHINFDGQSYRLDYNGTETKKTALQGNGDFRSEECTQIKNDADIVITNPPFSIWRQFMQWVQGICKMAKRMKKFLVIGNANAITYKEIFPHIKNNKMWMGVSFNKSKWFKVPDDYKKMDNATGYKEENGEKYILVKSIAWFTNMEHNKRNEPLILTKKYDPALYPKYDNYDAINVDKVKDIPMDYDGVIGVPISVLLYNLEGYEIVGCPCAAIVPEGWRGMSKEFVDLYYAQGNTGQLQEGNRLACFLTNEGIAKVPYKRILIKKKIIFN